jgi:hypothetical protein
MAKPDKKTTTNGTVSKLGDKKKSSGAPVEAKNKYKEILSKKRKLNDSATENDKENVAESNLAPQLSKNCFF